MFPLTPPPPLNDQPLLTASTPRTSRRSQQAAAGADTPRARSKSPLNLEKSTATPKKKNTSKAATPKKKTTATPKKSRAATPKKTPKRATTLAALKVKTGSYILDKSTSAGSVGRVVKLSKSAASVLWMNGHVLSYEPAFLAGVISEFGKADEAEIEFWCSQGWIYNPKTNTAQKADDLVFASTSPEASKKTTTGPNLALVRIFLTAAFSLLAFAFAFPVGPTDASRGVLGAFMLGASGLRVSPRIVDKLGAIVPPPLPARACVYLSGVAEFVAGMLLLVGVVVVGAEGSEYGGDLCVAILLGVYPANIFHGFSQEAQRKSGMGGGGGGLMARIFMQLVLIKWAGKHASVKWWE